MNRKSIKRKRTALTTGRMQARTRVFVSRVTRDLSEMAGGEC